MCNGRYSKDHRLRNRNDYQRVFHARCSVADQRLVVYAVPNGREQSRLGLSVSRKLGGAVTRNSWKRRIREAFRCAQQKWCPSLDMIVVPRGGPLPSRHEIAESLDQLIPRLQRKLQARSHTPAPGEMS